MGITAIIRVFDAAEADGYIAATALRRTGLSGDPLSMRFGIGRHEGKCIVWNGRGLYDNPLIDALSMRSDVLTLTVNESVMASGVSLTARGEILWSAFHDTEQGLDHLQTFGDLPDGWEEHATRFRHRRAAEPDAPVDYAFDAPVDLFEQLTGLRHDADNGLVLDEYGMPPARPFWKFWGRA